MKEGQIVVLTLNMWVNYQKQQWVITGFTRPDTDLASFAMSAMKAKDNEYVPVDAQEVMVNTILLGGGEETTIEFEAPTPGILIRCSFPGHYALMQGTIVE